MITDSGAGLGETPPDRSPASSASEPHREAIELGLSRGRNAMAIFQDLVDSAVLGGSYQSVRNYIAKLRGHQSPEACAVIETLPGEECQVDYGDGPMVRDPESGKSTHSTLRADAGLQPKIRSAAGVSLQHTDVGRTA